MGNDLRTHMQEKLRELNADARSEDVLSKVEKSPSTFVEPYRSAGLE